MDVLVFDIHADFAHFRKIYSTSSPLTYSIIPPTSFYGIVGAIIGLRKEENQYLRLLNQHNLKVAIQVLQPVKKIRIGLNYVNTKGNVWVPKQRREGAHTQIRTEFLRFPKFRCYVRIDDSALFSRLVEYVQNHQNVYTVSLGLSECIANVEFIAFQPFEEKNDREIVSIATAIPERLLRKLEIEPGKEYLKERLPIAMNDERVVLCYDEVLFDASGQSLKAAVDSYWANENGINIVFLN
ncbi:type I-B CRISPR-associated protein Cas5b [Anoxybacillus rupiensis]|uniref:Type I-B CRISPR-associated protein Cas5b n=1 Tax=Anoxybacteroides rupiense TaxID=311460 RepID=A0ABD5ITI6_9BACL|nr:type I-B CRISPR-associated protein Cas5b [Anoxybacillus rupiensis]